MQLLPVYRVFIRGSLVHSAPIFETTGDFGMKAFKAFWICALENNKTSAENVWRGAMEEILWQMQKDKFKRNMELEDWIKKELKI